MEGKEQRFGIAGSALFDVVTTVTSCGAVNSAIESFTGIGGAVPFANLSASEVIFGGVGTGLYSILLYVLLAVFIGGLMVGRTPEWLGKKLEAQGDQARRPRHPDHAAGGAVLHGAGDREQSRARVDLRSRDLGRSWACTRRRASPRPSTPTSRRPTTTARRSPATRASSSRTPATSARTGSPSPTCSGGFDMLFARYAPILFALAVAGALAGKRVTPAGLGTMRTDNATFVGAADRRDRPRRRAHLLPRPAARPDRPGPDRTPLLSMKRDIVTSVIGIIVFTVLLGLVYPLVITGVSQVAFPGNANGQQIHLDGKLVGSKLIGQNFGTPVLEKNGKPKEVKGAVVTEPDPRYFQSRPSATEGGADNAAASTFSNHGPNSVEDQGSRRRKHQGLPRTEQEPVTRPNTTRADRGEDPGRRGQQLGLGPRPRNLAGERLDPGPPRRGRAPPLAARRSTA